MLFDELTGADYVQKIAEASELSGHFIVDRFMILDSDRVFNSGLIKQAVSYSFFMIEFLRSRVDTCP
jgi:hypothetical protein